MDRVEPDERVVALQWTVLPFLELGDNLVGDSADGRRRDVDGVQFFDVSGDIRIAGTQRIER